jgi:hypothetical protein
MTMAVQPSKASARMAHMWSAAAIGFVSVAFLALWIRRHPTGYRADFDHLHSAARLVIAGRNPYPLIGPGRWYQNRFPLYYPLPAILLITPFALLPLDVARYAFVALTGGILGYALAAAGGTRWRYAMLASRQYVECIILAHWTPLFFAMWIVPALGAFAVAKPTIGSALVAARARRQLTVSAIVGAILLTLLSFLVQPDWISWWWRDLRTANHLVAPILLPGGFLLVAALLRWRRPEARLLLALSVPPQTPSFYDPLLIFLVATSGAEIMVLIVAGHALDYLLELRGPFATMRLAISELGRFSILFFYLPALVMVLRRPNVGTLPRWLEKRAATVLPAWLAGTS